MVTRVQEADADDTGRECRTQGVTGDRWRGEHTGQLDTERVDNNGEWEHQLVEERNG